MVYLIIVGLTTIIFGVTSLLLISRARSRLSDGSIRRYMYNFAICLAFIIIFSVWQTTRSIFGVSIDIEGLSTYPEYIFIIFAYIAFIVASFRVLKKSEEFGFKEDGRKIQRIINEHPSKKYAQKFSEIKKVKIKKNQRFRRRKPKAST